VIRALVVGVAVLLTLAGGAGGASFTLSEVERRTAIQVGERSLIAEGFDREWRVTNGGGETVSVLTPFHRLAVASRHASFKNEPLTPSDVERVLRQDAGRLVVWVELRGSREDFARHYAPLLQVGTREIRPSFVQNERTALQQKDGVFLARCVYGFPVKDLDGGARVELAVNDVNGQAVSRFTIDLSAMR
jgi:hypothetical protein